ncbi:hypothetical protein ACIBCM_33120 [Streptomyces sp. NPDC051018]|uniref:hypothetical protein n=1 Tax=Streptomyces sp. NPDC051018 TaxID=3365639 RepID=UPI0037B8376D
MSDIPTRQPSTAGRGGRCCCLIFAVLPLVWFIAAPVLPEDVFWFPFWLASAVWSGPDGHGGIGTLFGQ